MPLSDDDLEQFAITVGTYTIHGPKMVPLNDRVFTQEQLREFARLLLERVAFRCSTSQAHEGPWADEKIVGYNAGVQHCVRITRALIPGPPKQEQE